MSEYRSSKSPEPSNVGRAVVDVATAWDARLMQAISRESIIYALRGAGSTGGIDPQAADHAIEDELIPRIENISLERPVAILYDGDVDNPSKPDIGYIVGRLRDRFDSADGKGISFLTAQADDWYYPESPGANLTNAHGRPFETFVFQRGTYPGDHNRFTQSKYLAAYPHYAQIYVGASGMLAAEQMKEYCRMAPADGAVNVTVIRALINQSLSREIGDKLAQATTEAEREKFGRMLEQRRQIFGQHWGNDGRFDSAFLEDLERDDKTHELVVLWDGTDSADIINCLKIDLNSPEIDSKFDAAGYFVKTQQINARQVPEGTTETVIVNSGATRDTAQGGDWICTSVGAGEEYVVHGDDFPDIYEYVEGSNGTFAPKRDPRKLVKLDSDVIFMAPWGEKQAVKKGGYLIERTIKSGPRAGQVERYGISQKDAEPDFVPA